MELIPLTAISPVDGRYRKHVQHLDEYFSEYALIKYRVLVEIEYFFFLEDKKFFKLSHKARKHLKKLQEDFGLEDAQEIKQIEHQTNHDVKAVEYFIKQELEKIGEKEIKEWRVVNHAFWCAWGVVMSEDDPELMFPNGTDMEDEVVREEGPLDSDQGATAADFDYIAYADQKMRLFWGELVSGRMIDDYKDGIDGAKFIEN